MKSKYIKILSLAALLLVGWSLMLSAQKSPTLPIVRYNPDPTAVGMGLTSGASIAGSHYIYSNPNAFFSSDRMISASYSARFLPNKDSYGNNSFYNSLSVAGKYKQCALFAGFRYQGKSKITMSTSSGDTKNVKPMDITFDLGFAYQFNKYLSLFGVGHFVRSYIGKTAYTGGGSIGVTYSSALRSDSLSSNPFHISFSVRNLGGTVQYGKKGGKYQMPGSIALGADIEHKLAPKWILVGATSMDYVIQPFKSDLFTWGIGANLIYDKKINIETGGTFMKGSSFVSIGGGYRLANRLDINLAYAVNLKNKEFNALLAGITCRY